MEKVYDPKKYKCTENINFNSFFKEYLNKTSMINPECKIETIMKELTDCEITGTELNNLKQITYEAEQNKDRLPPRPQIKNKENDTSEDVGDKKKKVKKDQFKTSYFVKINYQPSENIEVMTEDGSEFLVTVRVFFPCKYHFVTTTSKRNRIKNFRPSHEVVLLGSHTLADLRDKIICTNDIGCSINVDSNFETDLKPKELYPSGFIFIDNVFYNDFRNENAKDYSETVINWYKDKNITDFKTADMANTKIRDLCPRLGYPYLYQHQGKCEHVLIFTDARLTNKKDLYYSYPYYNRLCIPSARYCDICRKNIANFLVMESLRLPHDQTYLCKACFYSYNYVDGKKMDNFKAYHYYDIKSIL